MGNNKNVVAPAATVAQQQVVLHNAHVPLTLRAKRIAQVQVALLQQRIAAKATKFATMQQHANQQAYLLAVQQLGAQYGINPQHNTLAVRAVNTKQQHAPSNQAGACKMVRAWVYANPTGTVAQCKAALQGVNPATVQTQFNRARVVLRTGAAQV